MKKILFLIAILFVLCSCSNVLDNSTGTIQFIADNSRGISASIEYPSLLDKVWTLVAEKLDNGGTVGEGEYTDLLLTDSIGAFSVGSWRFTITDSSNTITGSVTATIRAGVNTIPITVHSTSNKGTLSVENCDFLLSKEGAVNYVDLYVDEQRVGQTNWTFSSLTSEDGDYYVLPTVTKQLSEGVHTVRFYYGTDAGGHSSDTINIRVVKGATTHFSMGEQEGNLTLTISFDIEEALV